jgi:hypothetical protein
MFASFSRNSADGVIGVNAHRQPGHRAVASGTVKLAAIIFLMCSILRAYARTPSELYGFSDAEIQRAMHGAILSKGLKETSEKELAGVVVIFFRKPVAELADVLLEGKSLKSDVTIRNLHVWKPDGPADKAFATLTSDAEMRTKLEARYEAYRKNGLKGAGKSGDELSLAIKEVLTAERWADYSKALLRYPANALAGMEHRFLCYRQEVVGHPAFILSHLSGKRGEHAAMITEQRYYVSQTYNCRFIASDCVEVPGGTLMFYVNCTFTDQVAGMGSGLKHRIGRQRMLTNVAAYLKRVREQLQK